MTIPAVLILPHNKGTTFPMLIFTKLMKSEHHNMQFSYIELPQHRAVNAVIMSRNSVTLLHTVKYSTFEIVACQFFFPQSDEQSRKLRQIFTYSSQ